jgi:hypothetical protein
MTVTGVPSITRQFLARASLSLMASVYNTGGPGQRYTGLDEPWPQLGKSTETRLQATTQERTGKTDIVFKGRCDPTSGFNDSALRAVHPIIRKKGQHAAALFADWKAPSHQSA